MKSFLLFQSRREPSRPVSAKTQRSTSPLNSSRLKKPSEVLTDAALPTGNVRRASEMNCGDRFVGLMLENLASANSTACATEAFLNSSRETCGTIVGATQLPYGKSLICGRSRKYTTFAAKFFTYQVVHSDVNQLFNILGNNFPTFLSEQRACRRDLTLRAAGSLRFHG